MLDLLEEPDFKGGRMDPMDFAHVPGVPDCRHTPTCAQHVTNFSVLLADMILGSSAKKRDRSTRAHAAMIIHCRVNMGAKLFDLARGVDVDLLDRPDLKGASG